MPHSRYKQTQHMSWLTTFNLTDKTLYIPVTIPCDGLFYFMGMGLGKSTITQTGDNAPYPEKVQKCDHMCDQCCLTKKRSHFLCLEPLQKSLISVSSWTLTRTAFRVMKGAVCAGEERFASAAGPQRQWFVYQPFPSWLSSLKYNDYLSLMHYSVLNN